MSENKTNTPKHQGKLSALDNLSLGISIVVAIAIGFALGYYLKQWTGYSWMLYLGIAWGLGAAGLNIYKAYKRAKKEYEGLENDPRYKYQAQHGYNGKDD